MAPLTISELQPQFQALLEEYFPALVGRMRDGEDLYEAVKGGLQALQEGDLSWARLNQTLHRASEAGMAEGFYRYYFLEAPKQHPYPVDRIFRDKTFEPPHGTNIRTLEQFVWGLRRFMYDAMLYWGNFRQAYRDLRQKSHDELTRLFADLRIDDSRLTRRGRVELPKPIPRDSRYLISEMACTSYGEPSVVDAPHVKLALDAFRSLQAGGEPVPPEALRRRTAELASAESQTNLFDLMYEPTTKPVTSDADVVAVYTGQRERFEEARRIALENTKTYLSICNDLDVYVATSMRNRYDFREMAETCDAIFGAPALSHYNIRYFDPTLSATEFHEDKGIIECLMVKTAKVVLYFAQHRESLGKVSEYAMGLSWGKPVIVLCPDDDKGRQLREFYLRSHPLMRLVEFGSGIVNGAMITCKTDHVVKLLERTLTNRMEFDLDRRQGSKAYFLLRERLTQTAVRVVTEDKLLTETFWNNWHGVS